MSRVHAHRAAPTVASSPISAAPKRPGNQDLLTSRYVKTDGARHRQGRTALLMRTMVRPPAAGSDSVSSTITTASAPRGSGALS